MKNIKKHNIYQPCDLCGIDVKIAGFQLDEQDGKKVFCCGGCQAIYLMKQSFASPGQTPIPSNERGNSNVQV